MSDRYAKVQRRMTYSILVCFLGLLVSLPLGGDVRWGNPIQWIFTVFGFYLFQQKVRRATPFWAERRARAE